ncbi:MAG TPA: cytochrome c maturation protein CcmE [Acidimicrobiales bacterium]|nr:cytochrome c maturation protein CcmE [Acidimicrobiales bacterium]
MTALDDTTAPAPAPAVAPGVPAAARVRARTTNPWRIVAVVVVVLGAVGFLVFKGLGDATVYFRTADEAVAQKAQLGTQRFRVEGAVVDGTVAQDGDHVRFEIISAGVTLPVVHDGDPPELFKAGIPVVLEGRWQGDHFASDRIMIKHSSEYRAKNSDRLDKAQRDVQDAQNPASASTTQVTQVQP